MSSAQGSGKGRLAARHPKAAPFADTLPNAWDDVGREHLELGQGRVLGPEDKGVQTQVHDLVGHSSVHIRPVEDRRLAVRLPGHQDESSPRLRVFDCQRTARSQNRNLAALRMEAVGAEAGFPSSMWTKPLKPAWTG